MQNLSFNAQCYALLLQIPVGRVTTYQALAHALNVKAYQAVGNAMNRNPNPVVVPCHRVVKADGQLGGYAFGAPAKEALLMSEGVQIKNGRIIDFANTLFTDFKTEPLKI
ncbi:MGMT family protein [Thiomicrorhabdus aquaedulcis]|uniref:MGMT family protein n=1 Tax=Thiomicrorhabdus aquaedulcis TaxID=2211106 RepID=UPI000FD6E918|nr:MGMT family protein [Thiomicrorhabdus aquaedulcis]